MCHTAAITDSYIHNALSSLSVKLNKTEIQVLITTCDPHIVLYIVGIKILIIVPLNKPNIS